MPWGIEDFVVSYIAQNTQKKRFHNALVQPFKA